MSTSPSSTSTIHNCQLTVANWNLKDFITKICKASLGFHQITLLLNDGSDCIWEEGQDADEDTFSQNLMKALPDLPCGGIWHGMVVTIDDFLQDFKVELSIANIDVWPVVERSTNHIDGTTGDGDGDEAPDVHKFIICGSRPVPMVKWTMDAIAAEIKGKMVQQSDAKEEDDDFTEIVQDDQPSAGNGHEHGILTLHKLQGSSVNYSQLSLLREYTKAVGEGPVTTIVKMNCASDIFDEEMENID